ncbi:hypothetical protein [Flavobacterium okayamense]|uniref:HipA-like C-terminal domain-containing protein n=1 Tax=Flavobacterium okayamense TaxID=2830782 RepID=A0ABM7S8J0_9FLAO|nr:hypothetical protein [Flavobacterium okayamense]BCY29690.1 hypothetical protein KK2020170_25580 [Flavobacterium okayamense]
MEQYIATYTDITQWNKKMYSSTGGTRAKNIYINPVDFKEYFFKGSKKMDDGTFKYTSEFWSEIVASKVGQWLGFNVLDYNIGFDINDEQQIGCLSKSMIDYSENLLSEGIAYLTGYDPKYNPETDESRYTFDFIQVALSSFNLSNHKENFIQMLIFDSIIGNSDRHQENWGFITKFKEIIEELDNQIATKNSFGKIFSKFKKGIAQSLSDETKKSNNPNLLRTTGLFAKTDFSPIYDSGCCLGRELLDERIELYLKDNQAAKSYILRGRSEVRWVEGGKPKHFDLLTNLYNHYPKVFQEVKANILKEFTEEKLKTLINNIDNNLPYEYQSLKLSEKRKQLMVKLVSLRIEQLVSIII